MEKASMAGWDCCWSCCGSPSRPVALWSAVSVTLRCRRCAPGQMLTRRSCGPGWQGPGEAGGVRLLGHFSLSCVRAQFQAQGGLDFLCLPVVSFTVTQAVVVVGARQPRLYSAGRLHQELTRGRVCSPDRSRYSGSDPWAAGLGWPPVPSPSYWKSLHVKMSQDFVCSIDF